MIFQAKSVINENTLKEVANKALSAIWFKVIGLGITGTILLAFIWFVSTRNNPLIIFVTLFACIFIWMMCIVRMVLLKKKWVKGTIQRLQTLYHKDSVEQVCKFLDEKVSLEKNNGEEIFLNYSELKKIMQTKNYVILAFNGELQMFLPSETLLNETNEPCTKEAFVEFLTEKKNNSNQ